MKDKIVKFLRDEAELFRQTAQLYRECEGDFTKQAEKADYSMQLLLDEADFIEETF